MSEQYKSPVKQKVDVLLKLTPEDKLHFKEAQESDPKFLNASRKLEESLSKCNGSKLRLTVPLSSSVSDFWNKKNTEIDATSVNLNSSHDEFDEMVAAASFSPINRNKVADKKLTKSPNDSSRLEKQIENTTLSDSTSYSSLSSTSVNASTLFGCSKTITKTNNELTSSVTAKPSDSEKTTKSRFVFRTATASKVAQIKNVEPERSKPSSSVTKTQNSDTDKYDVDSVLRELSYENHLPVGANRTRPNSPPKNNQELPKKPLNRSVVEPKVIEKDDAKYNGLNVQRRSSTSSSSFTSTSHCANSNVTKTFDTTCNESSSSPRTGFENLQNVLHHISNSTALKTTSNVSSCLFFNFICIYM